jgi:hypothetical protein
MLITFFVLVIVGAEYQPSKPTSKGCLSNCAICWEITESFTKPRCAQCNFGYFFDIEYISGDQTDLTICKSMRDFRHGISLNGYGRDCLQCGKHNYAADKNICKPCSMGCQTCNDMDGKCNECYKGPGKDDNYLLTVEGTCTCGQGGAQLIDGYCKCNNNDMYINQTTYECLPCNKCSRDQGRCSQNSLSQIGIDEWDDDNKDCPKKCHSSCISCHGPTNSDCNICKADFLWEGNSLESKCQCIKNAQEVNENGEIKCKCLSNRQVIDVCSHDNIYGVNKQCNEDELNNRFQCMCPPGFKEGNINEAIQCTRGKFNSLYYPSLNSYVIFVGGVYYQYPNKIARSIADGFNGIWEDGFDYGFVLNETHIYFFKGSQCILYNKSSNQANGTVVSGYPKDITKEFHSLQGVYKTAIYDWINYKIYFLNGKTGSLYYVKTKVAHQIYSLNDIWSGIFRWTYDFECGAILSKDEVVLFKGDEVLHFMILQHNHGIVKGYPKNIGAEFPELSSLL